MNSTDIGDFIVTPLLLFICYRAAQGEQKVQNVKRENKLYSYAEQMAEIELQKVCYHLPVYCHPLSFVSG